MSSADMSGANAGKAGPAIADDIQRYVSAVDNLLLDVPWRHRRELIAGLREHIRENPEQITIEPPEEYAAELRATADATPGGLLSGFRSLTWPTPLEWWESVLRGGAIVMVVLVVYDFLALASQALVGDAASSGSVAHMIDSSLRSMYPTPSFRGSTRDGLLIFPLLAILVGQLSTAAVLQRAPHRRPMLRNLSYVSFAIIMALLGYGALRSFS